jgi:MFS transporter, DHA3 family, macrolide efflux protein
VSRRRPDSDGRWWAARPPPWLPSEPAVVPRLAVATGICSGAVEAAAVALAVVVYERTGSTAWVSAALVVSLGLSALLGPFGGVIADRYPRRTVMMLVAAIDAVVFALVGFVPETWQMIAVSAVGAIVLLPFEGSATAVIPTLVPDDELPSATSTIAAAQQTATLVGPVVAGVGVGLLGRMPVYLVIGGLFAAAALAVRALPAVPVAAVGGTMRADVREGLRALFADRVILTATAAATLLIGFSAATLVAGVPFSEDELGAGEAGYGLMVSAWGGGMVAGSLIAGGLIRRHSLLLVIAGGLLLAGISLATVAAAPNLAVTLVSLATGGFGNGAMNTSEMVLYQRRIPNAILGRVRAMAVAALRIAYAVSFLIGGVLAAAIGPRGVFAAAGIGIVLTALPVIALLVSRRERAPAEPPATSG